ncbi:MAG: PDZ domain-containing protein [bacterium]
MNRKHSFLILAALLLVAGSAVIAADTSEKSEKKESRAFLGVFLDDVSEKTASDYGAPSGQGALVSRVSSDSPAEEAGLRANDIIVKFAGTAVKNSDDLRKMLREKNPGDIVTLTLIRGGKERTIEVTLGKRSRSQRFGLPEKDIKKEFMWALPEMPEMPETAGHAWAGVHLQDLTEGLAKYFGVEEGVLISDVEKESPAEKAGIETGDIIVRIDGHTTNDLHDVQRWVGRHEPEEKAKFEVVRKGASKTIEVELGESPRPPTMHGFSPYGLRSHSGRRQIYRDEDLRELLEDIPRSIEKIDPDEFGQRIYKFRKDLQPQLEELKERLRDLEKELQRLKEERSSQQKM